MRPKRLATIVATGVLLAGVAATWVGPDSAWSDRCPAEGKREGAALTTSVSLVPPGTECTVASAGGVVVTDTYVPWREWLIVAFVAGVSWILAFSSARGLERLRAALVAHRASR